jgi:hypothetical protein
LSALAADGLPVFVYPLHDMLVTRIAGAPARLAKSKQSFGKEGLLLVNKKQQKNFFDLAPGGSRATGPE